LFRTPTAAPNGKGELRKGAEARLDDNRGSLSNKILRLLQEPARNLTSGRGPFKISAGSDER